MQKRKDLFFKLLFTFTVIFSLIYSNGQIAGYFSPAYLLQANNNFLPFVMKHTAPILFGPGTWPMAGANPQRTSWTSTEVTGNLKAEWFKHFDSYISQKVQIIAADNKLFISASDGLHALSSNSGNELWFFRTSLPPGHSPTYEKGVVYLGSFDRKLYAINAANGTEIWNFTAEAGFETNPLVVDGLVLAGNRDGYFYAVYAEGQNAGKLAWRYKTGGAILYSAAYLNGTVFFAAQDNHAYALNVTDGSLKWKSAKLPGAGFHSWWPVVYQDYVVFSGSYPYRITRPFENATHVALDKDAYPSNATRETTIGPTGSEPGTWAAGTVTMNASRISQYFEQYPHRRTTVVLSLDSGKEYTFDADNDGKAEYAPFLYFGTYSGNRYPPAVGPDNVLYQANNYIRNDWIPRGHITGWKFGTTTISIPTTATNAVDEPIAYAIGGNTVYWIRCCDRTAGSFSLAKQSGALYFDEGGIRLRRTLPALFALGWDYAYWKHGDPSPPIPYNDRVYIIANNAVVAFSRFGKDPVLPLDEDRGSSTGLKASDIERANTITGLNTKVTVDSATWPLLYQQERYYEFDEQPAARANHFRLFEVAGATSGSPSSVNIAKSAVLSTITSAFSGGTLTTYVSNRAPGILFDNSAGTYQLKGNFAGIAYPTAGGVRVSTGSINIPGSSLSESWLLVWDSTAQHRWMPVVISLQNEPAQVAFSSTGLTLSFSGAAGHLAATPLYGMSAPKSSEETSWRSSIPAATIERVKLVNRLARAYPISGTETLNINASSGDAVLGYSYQYRTYADKWSTPSLQLAYLPPHLALAAWNGSPIRVNGMDPAKALTDIQFVTPLGRVAGVAGASTAQVTLPGLANVWRQAQSRPALPSSNDSLQARLVEEVQKMIQAGHLLPGYGSHGIWDSKARDRLGVMMADYWHNPAETIYTLIRALPLLPENMQSSVKQHISSEFASYPTHSFTNTGWTNGTSREAFDLPPEVLADRGSVTACGACNATWGFSPENHYASWMYAANFGDASSIFNKTTENFTNVRVHPQSLSYSLNSSIAGHIGYLRLAALSKASAKPEVEKALVDMLVRRAALSKYPSALQSTGFEYGGYKWAVRTFAPNMPDTLFVLRTIGTLWSQAPLYGYPISLIYGLSGPGEGGAYVFGIDYVNLTPELGAFMRSYTLKEETAAISDYERRAPYWFVVKAEEGAGEGVIRPLYDPIALFQAKAYILRATRADLEQYLDVPAVPVGDLYYIQKLIMALEAAR